MRRALIAITAAALGAVAPGCSEPAPDEAPGATGSAGTVATACTGDEPVVTCTPAGTSLALPAEPRRAAGAPIRIGTINQETGPAGAFPELTLADRAAVRFVNEELGGVGGRPLELVACDTRFSPQGSQACAQQMVDADVVAVVGGIDVFGDGITILERNGIPYVGGIPVSFPAVRSPLSFQFSGGSWGAVLGLGAHAARELGAQRVSILYGDFGPIADAAEYGRRALEELGVAVRTIPMPIVGADMLPLLTTANEGDPDAIIVLTADTGCVPAMQTAADIGITAPLMLTGACAAPKILDDAGDAAEGSYFNIEGPEIAATDDPDSALYTAVIERYGDGVPAQSAATVSFRAFMNLYAVLLELGPDAVTPDAIADTLRAARARPNFTGHPFTCDGEQLAGFPAVCAPQQIVARMRQGALVQVSDWIQVGELEV